VSFIAVIRLIIIYFVITLHPVYVRSFYFRFTCELTVVRDHSLARYVRSDSLNSLTCRSTILYTPDSGHTGVPTASVVLLAPATCARICDCTYMAPSSMATSGTLRRLVSPSTLTTQERRTSLAGSTQTAVPPDAKSTRRRRRQR